jgi:CMP-N-acetylneuraminic acid synthetase
MGLQVMALLVIIPARCGSKGITKKNVVDLCGKPLLYYTITPALKLLQSNMASCVIVSTDCDEIADIARELGAQVPFLRPEDLGSDTAPSIGYVLHALDFFGRQGKSFEAVLVLQPTSPLRTYEDMREAVRLFQSHHADSLISGYKEEKISDLIMYRESNGMAVPLNEQHNRGIRRQDQSKIFIRNGAIYLATTEHIKKTQCLISDRPVLYQMPKSRSVNIDTADDLELIRGILCR